MQDSFRRPGGAGRIDDIGKLMRICFFEAFQRRLVFHDLIKQALIQNEHTVCILSDKVDPLLRVIILHEDKSRAGTPNTQHATEKMQFLWHEDLNDLLCTDPFFFQETVNLRCLKIQFGKCDALAIRSKGRFIWLCFDDFIEMFKI